MSAARGRTLRRREVLEVYEVRASLERDAVRLAAQRATEEDLAALRAALAEQDRAQSVTPSQYAAFGEADLHFHQQVVAASGNGIPTLAPYAAGKGGINQLVRTLAAEWAEHRIRGSAVAPGYVANIMDNVTAHDDPASDQRINTFTPLGRRATVEEVAGPCGRG